MNEIFDFFKTTFENEFQTTMTGDRIASALALSFFMTLFLVLIYKATYQGIAFSRTFAYSLILLSMVTSVVIMAVTTNLALSLGMVGALSIIRFRTAVKDPLDTIFMFWAITIGIMAGAGLIYITMITNVALGALYWLLITITRKRTKTPYLLSVRYLQDREEEILLALKNFGKMRVKSKIITPDAVDLCLEIALSDKTFPLIGDLSKLDGVLEASAVSYRSDTTL